MTDPNYIVPSVKRQGISLEQARMMEHSSKNFFELSGKNMRIPPRLYEDLKNFGVNMKYMDADPLLENRGAPQA